MLRTLRLMLLSLLKRLLTILTPRVRSSSGTLTSVSQMEKLLLSEDEHGTARLASYPEFLKIVKDKFPTASEAEMRNLYATFQRLVSVLNGGS